MKTRVSSSVYSYAPIGMHLGFLVLLFRILNVLEKYQTSSDKIVIIITVTAFWGVSTFLMFKYKTVFMNNDYMYLRMFFKTKRVAFSDIKEVNPKRGLFGDSSLHVVKYIDDNMMLKTIEFFPSFSNSKALESFKQKVQNQKTLTLL